MATPVGLFRPHTVVARDDEHLEQVVDEPELSIEVVEPPVLPPQGTAVEFDESRCWTGRPVTDP